MKRKATALDIVVGLAAKATFVFLTVVGFMLYVEYEWMMKK